MANSSDITTQKTSRGVKATLNKTANVATKANGNGLQKPMSGDEALRVATGLIQRLQLASMAGLQYEGQRNLYQVFGYKNSLKPEDFLAKYHRQDIASRIIDAPAAALWTHPPEFRGAAQVQAAWDELDRKVKLWSTMYRADRLARLNTFSLLLFGFDDGAVTSRPLNTNNAKELLYVRAFGARLVKEISFVSDTSSPRFGLPEMYKIEFDDPTKKTVTSGNISVKGQRGMEIHHSRVVHIVENPLEDRVFGIPIIEKVYNLLDDLLKVSGGTAETYWLTGNRGLQADIDKEMQLDPTDVAELADEIEEYMHQLRRFIRTRGVDLKVLDSKTPTPKEVFEMIIALLSGTTGIPKRILLGSEAGQLASEQDRANWAERIGERRKLFAEPMILEPAIDLLQTSGLLPEGNVEFKWPSAFILSPLEASQVQAQKARAIGNISRQTGNKVPMQITSRTEAREIMELEGDLPESELIEPPEEPAPAPFGAPNGSEDSEEPERPEED